MTILPAILSTAVKQMHHWLREIAYEEMAHQASGWVHGEYCIEKKGINQKPIKLNFGVPKKNRLAWIHRTIHHQPH